MVWERIGSVGLGARLSIGRIERVHLKNVDPADSGTARCVSAASAAMAQAALRSLGRDAPGPVGGAQCDLARDKHALSGSGRSVCPSTVSTCLLRLSVLIPIYLSRDAH